MSAATTTRTLEEDVLYYALSLTWVWYVFGALYVVAPVIAWLLLALWLWRFLDPSTERLANRPMTGMVIVWWSGMLVMLVALVIGHFNWDLGIAATIKSTIGWMKGWALFAVFVLTGACLHVRPKVLYQAATNVAVQTLFIIPFLVVAPFVGLPGTLYVSPIMALGGPGPEYFTVELYGQSFDGSRRWRFFAPWGPAAAVAFGILIPLILRNQSLMLRMLGCLVVVAVVLMCKSRLGMIAIPAIFLLSAGLYRLTDPRVYLLGAITVFTMALSSELWIPLLLEQIDNVRAMRADSSYVREALGRIALHRWWTEAPIWGHGIVERGPLLVEFMPIGSHHSWYGLLFVKGAVGFLALLLPLLYSWCELTLKAQTNRSARVALTLVIFVSFTTFTENLEILAYIMWPAFVMIGIASRERMFNPFRSRLGSSRSAGDAGPALQPNPAI